MSGDKQKPQKASGKAKKAPKGACPEQASVPASYEAWRASWEVLAKAKGGRFGLAEASKSWLIYVIDNALELGNVREFVARLKKDFDVVFGRDGRLLCFAVRSKSGEEK
jgi:hypothetical protein